MTSKPKKTLDCLPPIVPRNPKQDQYLRQLQTDNLIFGLGPAGTGKTFLATAVACHKLAEDDEARLIVVRPTVTVEDENLGALPGGLDEKMGPFVRPVLDELSVYAGKERVKRWISTGRIEFLPVAFIRGRNLVNCFIHVTESQNLTMKQLEAIVTRIGANSVMVIEGDPVQTDLPRGDCCELLISIACRGGIRHSVTRFDIADVVRSDLVRQWVEAFSKQKEASPG